MTEIILDKVLFFFFFFSSLQCSIKKGRTLVLAGMDKVYRLCVVEGVGGECRRVSVVSFLLDFRILYLMLEHNSLDTNFCIIVYIFWTLICSCIRLLFLGKCHLLIKQLTL